jgi:hypothetical protein
VFDASATIRHDGRDDIFECDKSLPECGLSRRRRAIRAQIPANSWSPVCNGSGSNRIANHFDRIVTAWTFSSSAWLAPEYVLFLETTGRLNGIEVIVDRRLGEERRGPHVETIPERRVAQRRGAEPETWRRSGFISVPPRTTSLPWADLLLTEHVIEGEAGFPRPSLMPSRYSSNVDVDVQGVDDPLLLAQISGAMPHLFHHWSAPGRSKCGRRTTTIAGCSGCRGHSAATCGRSPRRCPICPT